MWQQTLITLRARPRGFHLVTDELLAGLPEIKACRVGLLHLWLQHTSASLTINENADPAVRRDFERFFNRLIPQGTDGYEHNDEGLDDLPAHFKASVLGCQLSLPIQAGRLALGTWQGVYLGEHRDQGGARKVLATLHGEEAKPLVPMAVEFFPAAVDRRQSWAITNLLFASHEVEHERR